MKQAIYIIIHGKLEPTVLVRQDIQAAIEKADSIALAQVNGNRDYLKASIRNNSTDSLVYTIKYERPGYGDNYGLVYVYQKFLMLKELLVLE